MINYMRIEFLKLKKSRYKNIMLLATALFQVIFCVYYLLYLPQKEGLFNFAYSVAMQLSLSIQIYEINAIVFCAFLFAKEYQERTFLYTMIRPIKSIEIFLSKVGISLIYSTIIVMISILSLIIMGYIFFDYVPFSVTGRDYFMQDLNTQQSYYRMIIFMISIIVGITLSAAISVIYSCLIKNFLGTVILSIVTFLLVSFPIQLKDGSYFSISSYQFPNYLMEKKFETYSYLQMELMFKNIFMIFLLYLIGYSLVVRNRKKVN